MIDEMAIRAALTYPERGNASGASIADAHIIACAWHREAMEVFHWEEMYTTG